jgi:hypothetical protein
MLVLGVHVRMRVKGPVAVTMFVFVLHVLVGVGVSDSAGMSMLVSMLLTVSVDVIQFVFNDYRLNPILDGRGGSKRPISGRGGLATTLLASQPIFEMSNVLASKRIGQAPGVCSVELGLTRHEMLLQHAPMNRHVTFTQS